MNKEQKFAKEWDISLVANHSTKRDRDIFLARLCGKTQKQCADEFGLSASRVKQVTEKIIRRVRLESLKSESRINNLKPENTVIIWRNDENLGLTSKEASRIVANHAYFLAESFNDKAPN